MSETRCVWKAEAKLGEGPVWHAGERALYFVDIERPAILRFAIEDGRTDEYLMPEKIGCIAFRERGGLVAGCKSGFAFVDLERRETTPIADPEADLPGNRFNDGKCDARGRFWAGTMDAACRQPTGVLYRLDPDRTVHRMDDGYVITNGPAWSPDGRTLYHNDTMQRTVFAFDCDPSTGSIDNKRVFVRIPDADGYPDGMSVDSDGGLWLAHWGGSRVTRFTPKGRVDRVVRLPASQVTSCTFGGSELRTLYITTARIGLDAATLLDEPLAGGLFAVDVDIPGLPAHRFGG
ncbi:MAG: SMP-30/gluconolactonase/LRE family protein [Planctomycetes bacterium]|nr:SMP-30/gluconolactonase/LRE family protein [Planctomycetota bacterium]